MSDAVVIELREAIAQLVAVNRLLLQRLSADEQQWFTLGDLEKRSGLGRATVVSLLLKCTSYRGIRGRSSAVSRADVIKFDQAVDDYRRLSAHVENRSSFYQRNQKGTVNGTQEILG